MSKIVIDARESGTSTGRYIDNLITQLHALKPTFEITILAKPGHAAYFKKETPDFPVIAATYKEFTLGEQLGFRRQLESLKPDLVHFGKDHQPILYKGKVVTTMHDLTTARFTNPAKFWPVFKCKQFVYKWVVKRVAHKSAAILTGSQFVKDDLVNFTGVSPDKITVTYEAAEPIKETAEPVAGLADKQFLMYVGRPTPHKNLERLIAAFAQLQAQHPDLLLVLAGKKDANYKRIEKTVQNQNIRGVVFAGFVSEGQLRWLYEHCAVYVFPSLSEGFGLPGLEAMAHGAPVASSNATCLPEIYGEAAHYFDPLNVQNMADTIAEILTNQALRAALIQNGKTQVKKYSWRRMAEQTLAVYNQLLSG